MALQSITEFNRHSFTLHFLVFVLPHVFVNVFIFPSFTMTSMHFDVLSLRTTNTMTKTWGKTKTKTGKDKKVENKRITVKFSNRLQRHLATIF